uniref:Uncharacterized protein n=1 Tax=Rhizophora mucronata TaxID=61149 RepID=A0A2P2NY18_RHIMU
MYVALSVLQRDFQQLKSIGVILPLHQGLFTSCMIRGYN